MGSAICRPAPIETRRKFYYCRKCKKRRLHFIKFFEWYMPYAICLTCDTLLHFEE